MVVLLLFLNKQDRLYSKYGTLTINTVNHDILLKQYQSYSACKQIKELNFYFKYIQTHFGFLLTTVSNIPTITFL